MTELSKRITQVEVDLASQGSTLQVDLSSLPSGTSFVDLIGQGTVIDSYGNIYASANTQPGAPGSLANYPAIGKPDRKYFGLHLNNFDVNSNGDTNIQGNIILGQTGSNSIKLNGTFISDLVPNATNTYGIGNSDNYFKASYITTVNAGTVNATTLNVTSATNLTSHLLPSADNSYDLGSSTLRWRSLYLGSDATIGTTLAVTGATTLSSTLGVSGAITAPTSSNTINSLIINSGALSGVTGITTSGGYTQSGTTANAFTGATTLSVNGAASTPSTSLTGTWFTGGTATTTKPQLLIEPTGTTSTAWSTSGTGLGINATSGFGGDLINAQVASSWKFSVGSTGVIHTSTGLQGNYLLDASGLQSLGFSANDTGNVMYFYNTWGAANPGISRPLLLGHKTAVESNAGPVIEIGIADNGSYAPAAITTETPTVSFTPRTATITGAYTTQRFIKVGQSTITASSSLNITNADTLSIVGAPISAGSATITNAVGLRISSETSVAAGVTNAYGLFVDAPTGATNNYAAVFGSGNVGIGTTAPEAPLEVKGTGTGATIAKFTDVNTTGCTLATGGTISCSSDRNLKKNIEELPYGLDTLMALNPVEFNWNYQGDGTTKSLGFIAQDVETVVPNLVMTDPSNGQKQLNTIGLVPVLAKSLQQINNKVDVIARNEETKQSSDGKILKQVQDDNKNLKDQIIQLFSRVNNLENSATTSATLSEPLPFVLDASSSALLVSSGSTTNAENLLVGDTLSVLGRTILSDLGVTGNINAGLLYISGIDGEINTLAGNLRLQSNGLNGVDILAGKIVIDNKGNITSSEDLSAKTVSVDELKVSSQTLGKETIKSGDSSVIILTDKIASDSSVFITSLTKTDKVLSVDNILEKKSFDVFISSPDNKDIRFNWWIVGVKD